MCEKTLNRAIRCLLGVVVLGGCSILTDPSDLVGPGAGDGGPMDAADGTDGGDGADGGVPDACVAGDEVCNEADDDCDGTVDEEPTECSFPNGVTGCVSGVCELVGCAPDYGDCDATVAGCEASLLDDRRYCGSCDMACGLEERCESGGCAGTGVQWATFLTGLGSGYLLDVQLDDSGSVLVRGRSDGEGAFAGAEIVDGLWFVAQLDPDDGSEVWTQTLSPDGAGMAQLNDLYVNPLGVVHVVGEFAGRVVTEDGLPLLDGGSFHWSMRPNGTTRDIARIAIPTTGFASVRAVEEHASGDLVIAGFLEGELDGEVSEGRDLLLALGPASTLSYVATGGPGHQEAFDIAATSDGLCVSGAHIDATDFGAGPLPSRTAGLDAFVACFSRAGVHQWSKGYSGAGQDIGRSIAVDADDNIYLLITTAGPLTVEGEDVDDTVPGRIVVVSYAPDGALRWVVPTQMAGVDSRIGVGPNGHVLISGGSGAALGIESATIPNQGGQDAVVVALDPVTGGLLWARAIGGAEMDRAAQAAGEEGQLFIAGTFRDVVMFDEVAVADANDGFVVRTD